MDVTPELRQTLDFEQGHAEAEAEIAAGRLGHRAFGKLVTWWDDVARLLQERYQITATVVGGCTTRTNVKVRALGYNERMSEEIAFRFGADVVAATKRELTLLKSRGRVAWGGAAEPDAAD